MLKQVHVSKDVRTFHIMFSQGNDEYKQRNPGTFPPNKPLVKRNELGFIDCRGSCDSNVVCLQCYFSIIYYY